MRPYMVCSEPTAFIRLVMSLPWVSTIFWKDAADERDRLERERRVVPEDVRVGARQSDAIVPARRSAGFRHGAHGAQDRLGLHAAGAGEERRCPRSAHGRLLLAAPGGAKSIPPFACRCRPVSRDPLWSGFTKIVESPRFRLRQKNIAKKSVSQVHARPRHRQAGTNSPLSSLTWEGRCPVDRDQT